MVTRESELAAFFFNQEVIQLWLLRKLIAETDAVVIDTETDQDGTTVLAGLPTDTIIRLWRRREPVLRQGGHILIVVVTNVLRLAPYRFPCLVKSTGLFFVEAKIIHEVTLVHAHRGMLVLGQLKTEMGRTYNILPLISHTINWSSRFYLEVQRHVAVGRLHLCCQCCQWKQQESQ